MKNIIYSIAGMLLALSITACTEDEEMLKAHGQALEVLVATEELTSADNSTTRVTDTGYSTNFTSGDRIGIFAITSDGVILEKNIAYQYDGTDWKPVDADKPMYHYNYAGVTYFAYYPYSTVMDDATSEDDIVSKFTIKDDQSAQADYTASDLMAGAGSVTTAAGSMSVMKFTLKHKMSLFIIDIKNRAYITDNGYEYSEPIGSLSLKVSADGSDISNQLYHFSTTAYRYITTPGTAISAEISYTAGKESITYSYKATVDKTTAEKYHLINMRRGETIRRNLQVGDFYYQDGSIVPGSEDFYQFSGNQCIGVVFKVGTGKGDSLGDYEGKLTAIHGYVLALQQSSQVWGDGSRVFVGGDGGSHFGYKGTQILLKAAAAESKSFPACMYCVNYTPAAPTGITSGWYYPATAQMRECAINANSNGMNTQLAKISGAASLSGTYSSCSDVSASQCWGARVGNGSYFYLGKGSNLTRAVFTF